ncbi:restriction endonuclease subunit S [Corallococcus sp. M7]
MELRIPASWKIVNVGQAGDVQLGRQRSPEHHSGPHMRPYLRVANVLESRIDTSDVLKMNFTPEEYEQYKLTPGDILLNEGQSLELVGRAAMYQGEVPGACFQNTLIRFRSGPEVLPEFALLVFRVYLHTGVFQGIAKRTTNIAHLGTTRFAGLPFPLPPLEEQKQLIEKTSRQLARINAGEERLLRVQKNLSLQHMAVLTAACEGKLVTPEAELAHMEGRAYQGAAELLHLVYEERQKRQEAAPRRKVRTGDSSAGERVRKDGHVEPTVAQLPALPEGWKWTFLREIADLKGGLTKGQKRAPNEAVRQVHYLRVANVQRGWLDLSDVKTIAATEAEIEELRLMHGDVLFNEGGDRDKLGRGWIWENQIPICIHQNHVFRARILANAVIPKLLSWYGNSIGQEYFLAQAKQTTNLASINLTKLGSLPVPVPPQVEQQRIVTEVEKRLSALDATTSAVVRSLGRAERLRKAVLRSGLEGRFIHRPIAEDTNVLITVGQVDVPAEDAKGTTKPKGTGMTVKSSDQVETFSTRRSIKAVLQEQTEPITPAQVFQSAGFDVNSVDAFFVELRSLYQAQQLVVERPNDTDVFLSMRQE